MDPSRRQLLLLCLALISAGRGSVRGSGHAGTRCGAARTHRRSGSAPRLLPPRPQPPAPPATTAPTTPLLVSPVGMDGCGRGHERQPWWNDAFYEVFVRSFYDSDGDGIGDLNGLIRKLDYLNDGDPARPGRPTWASPASG